MFCSRALVQVFMMNLVISVWVHLPYSGLQIKGDTEDNSEIIFLISR